MHFVRNRNFDEIGIYSIRLYGKLSIYLFGNEFVAEK